MYCLFFYIIQFFSRIPKVLVRTPGGTRTPDWESLSYGNDKTCAWHTDDTDRVSSA